jgi:hypothetical protein
MIRLVEVVIGVVLIFIGLDRFSVGGRIRGLFFGLIAIVGLILVVHGILLYTVPDFFASSY